MPSSSVIAVCAKSTGLAMDQDLRVTAGSSGEENTTANSTVRTPTARALRPLGVD